MSELKYRTWSVLIPGNTQRRVRDLLPTTDWLGVTLMHYTLPPTLSSGPNLTRTTISIYQPGGNTSGDPSEGEPLTLCSLVPIWNETEHFQFKLKVWEDDWYVRVDGPNDVNISGELFTLSKLVSEDSSVVTPQPDSSGRQPSNQPVNHKMATTLVDKLTQYPRLQSLPAPLSDTEETSRVRTQDPRLHRMPVPLSDTEETSRFPTPCFPCGDRNSGGHTDDTISQEQSSLSSKSQPPGLSEDAYRARVSRGLSPSRYNPYHRQGRSPEFRLNYNYGQHDRIPHTREPHKIYREPYNSHTPTYPQRGRKPYRGRSGKTSKRYGRD